MVAKKSKSSKSRTTKKLKVSKKTVKDLSSRSRSVRGGLRGVGFNSESCIIAATCVGTR